MRRALLAACAGAVLASGTAGAAGTDERPFIRPTISGLQGSNGWYRSDVTVRWEVSDPAGIRDSSGCGPQTLRNDTSGTRLRCSATTNASSPTSRSVSVTIKIDRTPPVLADVAVVPGVGANALRWRSTSASDTVAVERSARGAAASAPETVFRGAATSFADTGIRDGEEYVYTLRSLDEAGNASAPVSALALPKVLVLRRLPYVPRVSVVPVLRWRASPRATYYHVQLFRGGKRILASWPAASQLALRETWNWRGHRHHLEPGTYRWYVWAGVGPRSAARYARVGTAAFTVLPTDA